MIPEPIRRGVRRTPRVAVSIRGCPGPNLRYTEQVLSIARFRPAPKAAPSPGDAALFTGVSAIDRVIGPGGLPRGQITEWIGGASSGKTGALRTLVDAVRRTGVAVGWIDGPGQLMAADWTDPGAAAPLWVVRPPVVRDVAFCAEVLLRTQSFGLVVLDGGPPLNQSTGVRLQRMARQSNAVLIRVRPPHARATRPVARRLEFQPMPQSTEAPNALARRAPLVWPIDLERSRGGEPASGQLHLVEPLADRVAAYVSGPDRPSTRTKAGTRYGL